MFSAWKTRDSGAGAGWPTMAWEALTKEERKISKAKKRRLEDPSSERSSLLAEAEEDGGRSHFGSRGRCRFIGVL